MRQSPEFHHTNDPPPHAHRMRLHVKHRHTNPRFNGQGHRCERTSRARGLQTGKGTMSGGGGDLPRTRVLGSFWYPNPPLTDCVIPSHRGPPASLIPTACHYNSVPADSELSPTRAEGPHESPAQRPEQCYHPVGRSPCDPRHPMSTCRLRSISET